MARGRRPGGIPPGGGCPVAAKIFVKSLKANEDRFKIIAEKLENYFKPCKNLMYERYVFKQAKQKQDESTLAYMTRLKNLGKTCEFENPDNEIRDTFVSTCTSMRLKKKLLREENLTLDNLIKIGRG